MNTPNILITTGIYPPDIGGPATYVQQIAEALSRQGYTVTVVTYADEICGSEQQTPYRVHRVSRTGSAFLRYSRYFWTVLREVRRHDLVYAQGPLAEGLPTYLATRLVDRPYVLKIVGDYAWEQGKARYGVEESLEAFQRKRVQGKLWFWRYLQRLVMRKAGRVVVPSQHLKGVFVRIGMPEDHIQVITNAISLPTVHPEKEMLRNVYNMQGFCLLFVGRYIEIKRIDFLIRAIVKMHASFPQVTLTLIGDGPLKAVLESLVHAHSAEDYVHFLPPQPHEKVLERIRAADALVLTSEHEGLAHVLIEAAMLGTPAIVSDAGGNTEVIAHEKNGLVYPAGDEDAFIAALTRMLDGSWTYRKIERPEQFTYEYMITKLVDTLMQVYAYPDSRNR